MRILHIVGGMNRAGAETMLMNNYRLLDAQKYQFDFVYFTSEKCDYDTEIEYLGGKIFRIPSKNLFYRYFRYFVLLISLRDHNCIHSHMNINNSIYLFIAWITGKKCRISHSHGTAGIYHESFLKKVYKSFSFSLIRIFANVYIACGEAAGQFLYPNVNKNLITLIPNAIDVDDFITPEILSQGQLKNELNLNNEVFLITQIGRLSKVKNHVFTIHLIHHLIKNRAKCHLVIVGEGELKNDLSELIENLNLQKNITFLGLRKDVNNILANTDVLIMPSFHEGFPLVLVESQASGVPALISNTISNEVDLGLDLIHFCDLNREYHEWAQIINKLITKNKVSVDRRRIVLADAGFDIKSSAKKIELIYERVGEK